MVKIDRIVGSAAEPGLAHRLHELEHRGAVEYLALGPTDTQRHRLRAMTDRGTECAIAIPRNQRLEHGSVLLIDAARAIVVHMQAAEWLELEARDVAGALELGYLAGNMHWKVEFDGPRLRVALQGPRVGYLERLSHLLEAGRITACAPR